MAVSSRFGADAFEQLSLTDALMGGAPSGGRAPGSGKSRNVNWNNESRKAQRRRRDEEDLRQDEEDNTFINTTARQSRRNRSRAAVAPAAPGNYENDGDEAGEAVESGNEGINGDGGGGLSGQMPMMQKQSDTYLSEGVKAKQFDTMNFQNMYLDHKGRIVEEEDYYSSCDELEDEEREMMGSNYKKPLCPMCYWVVPNKQAIANEINDLIRRNAHTDMDMMALSRVVHVIYKNRVEDVYNKHSDVARGMVAKAPRMTTKDVYTCLREHAKLNPALWISETMKVLQKETDVLSQMIIVGEEIQPRGPTQRNTSSGSRTPKTFAPIGAIAKHHKMRNENIRQIMLLYKLDPATMNFKSRQTRVGDISESPYPQGIRFAQSKRNTQPNHYQDSNFGLHQQASDPGRAIASPQSQKQKQKQPQPAHQHAPHTQPNAYDEEHGNHRSSSGTEVDTRTWLNPFREQQVASTTTGASNQRQQQQQQQHFTSNELPTPSEETRDQITGMPTLESTDGQETD